MKDEKLKDSAFSEQEEYIKSVKRIITERFKKAPLAMVTTYGCQQNVSDSEKIKGMLFEMGFDFTDDANKADFILCNTCAVREHAEDRVFGNVGALKHIKRRKPSLIIGICGCMAQQDSVKERIKRSYPYVDLLFGTHVQHRLPEFLYKLYNGGGRIFETSVEEKNIVEGVPVKRDGTYKGWLPIMYGCNNFCTYCIVPYVRGRERSRSYTDVISEAEQMVKNGCRDITLLGQNVNSYKSPVADGNGNLVNFPKLLEKINKIPGDFRIRFMTSHPKDCSEELLNVMSRCDKVCHHLHLPFQSGSDRILKLMNRKYDRQTYLGLVKTARRLMPDIAVTSDIIVGFPGETYEDFLDTLSLVKEVKFAQLFTFIFSKREGTPAYNMEDPVSRKEKGEWFRELLKVQEEVSKENERNLQNKTYRLLCDDFGRTDGMMAGHTDSNICLEFEGDGSLLGKFVTVETKYENNRLTASIKQEN